jgi:hypothetical protein
MMMMLRNPESLGSRDTFFFNPTKNMITLTDQPYFPNMNFSVCKKKESCVSRSGVGIGTGDRGAYIHELSEFAKKILVVLNFFKILKRNKIKI